MVLLGMVELLFYPIGDDGGMEVTDLEHLFLNGPTDLRYPLRVVRHTGIRKGR